jgi:ABC-type uncharacterized transport system permease subunit
MLPIAICVVAFVVFVLWFTPLGSRVGIWGEHDGDS